MTAASLATDHRGARTATPAASPAEAAAAAPNEGGIEARGRGGAGAEDQSDRVDDCLACRLTGAAALSSSAVFVFLERRRMDRAFRTSRAALGVAGTALLAGGIYRLMN
ncbi:MAG: hypothetical protein BJ554DRAFT_5868 [Olpidium bornovanus]|uniref:Distal membrane-arm assembly complex protein 1-like domain-containing protein n=1 Tax=Olpidium bornovanus TaxID=278681 RepID=A0A8H7ZYV6_9FUNG|nr:MAG: hypothetical protein BJ554DRAFT_5868 [Olpidium bornovanus]